MRLKHVCLLLTLLLIISLILSLLNLALSLLISFRIIRFVLLGLLCLWIIFKLRSVMLFPGTTRYVRRMLENEYGRYLAAAYIQNLDNLEKVAWCVLEKRSQVEDAMTKEDFEEIRTTLETIKEVNKKMNTKGLIRSGSLHDAFASNLNILIQNLKAANLNAEKLNITCSFWAILGEWNIVYSSLF